MSWPIVEAVALRVARILLIALLGAMADAGLLGGRVGDVAVHALPALSSKLSAAPVVLLLHPSNLA